MAELSLDEGIAEIMESLRREAHEVVFGSQDSKNILRGILCFCNNEKNARWLTLAPIKNYLIHAGTEKALKYLSKIIDEEEMHAEEEI